MEFCYIFGLFTLVFDSGDEIGGQQQQPHNLIEKSLLLMMMIKGELHPNQN